MYKIIISFSIIFLSFLNTQAQTKNIFGRIIDEDGSPIMGAVLFEKTQNKFVVSDMDGGFNMALPPEIKTIEVNCLGYYKKDVPFGDNEYFDVKLEMKKLKTNAPTNKNANPFEK